MKAVRDPAARYRASSCGGIEVIEQIDGAYSRTYEGVRAAASAWGTREDNIKNCIASGLPLNSPRARGRLITFDTPSDSPYSYDFIQNGDMIKAVLFVDKKDQDIY